MTFDAKIRREKNMLTSAYTASGNFLSVVGWKRQNAGNNLVVKSTGEDIVCIAVGKALDYRLNCSPSGNFNPDFETPLHKSKFQFTLGRPDNTVFATDYDKTVATLKKIQQTIASTNSQKNLILEENKTETNVRFSTAMFEAKVSVPRVTRHHGHKTRACRTIMVRRDRTPSKEKITWMIFQVRTTHAVARLICLGIKKQTKPRRKKTKLNTGLSRPNIASI